MITNTDSLLSEVTNQILPYSKSLDALVGYFYFSGYQAVARNLKDKKVRILVGMDTEVSITNTVKEIFHPSEKQSKATIKDKAISEIVDYINHSEDADSRNSENTFKLFIEKIKDGTLEIRKTIDPNHAKIYLFKWAEEYSAGGQNANIFITGSSNLTFSGLSGRKEFNLKIQEEEKFNQAQHFFDQIWDNESVSIVDQSSFDEFEEKVIKKVWMDKIYSPFLIYLKVLYEYFKINRKSNVKYPGNITKYRFKDLAYQRDAVDEALQKIEQHNGVIVADVVGLGKSIIASTIAHNLDLRTVIIAPPSLIDGWEQYVQDFGLKGGVVYSSGKISQALESEFGNGGEKLIIIDEAHRYRNEKTQDYQNLFDLCAGNKVVLLTATPFNNSPEDIRSMLKLFQILGKSTIKSVSNVSAVLARVVSEYKNIRKENSPFSEEEKQAKSKEISEKMRTLLEPVMIRRSRIDLQKIPTYREDLKRQKIAFSKVREPEILEYDLGEVAELYLWTLNEINPPNNKYGFKAAKYKATDYLKDYKRFERAFENRFGDLRFLKESQQNLAKFMRRLLVSRFESSRAAFQKTLQRMIASHQTIIDWYEKAGKVPIYKKGQIENVEDYFISDAEESEEALDEEVAQIPEEAITKLEEKGYFFIDKQDIRDDKKEKSFVEDLKKDCDLLENIYQKWFGDSDKIDLLPDPKIHKIIKVVEQKLEKEPNKKIVIFSESKDTVEYVSEQLSNHGIRTFTYTSSSHGNKEARKTLRQNFDAGIPEEDQTHQGDAFNYEVLVATDALSEGYNLHRAGIVFNYDIPFNPTRVIQRVGRINRINKKVFDELEIYNSFPSFIGKKEHRVEEIATLKMQMIHTLLGEDTKVIKSDETEELQSFLNQKYQQEKSDQEQESWDTKYRAFLEQYKNTETLKKAKELPPKARTVRKKIIEPADLQNEEDLFSETDNYVLACAKKGDQLIFKIAGSNQVFDLSPEKAMEIFASEREEEQLDNFSRNFESVYKLLKKELRNDKKEIHQNDISINSAVKIVKMALKETNDIYFEQLLKVLNYRGLPSGKITSITKLSNLDSKDLLAKLKVELPASYLQKFIQRVEKQEKAKEELILVEELIKD